MECAFEHDIQNRTPYLILFFVLGIIGIANIRMAVIDRVWIQTLIPVFTNFQGRYEEAVCQ